MRRKRKPHTHAVYRRPQKIGIKFLYKPVYTMTESERKISLALIYAKQIWHCNMCNPTDKM